MDDKNRGLYNKFKVERVDGRSAPGEKHANCSYLVLDLMHDPFARDAAIAYADSCEQGYPLLAKDIRKIIKNMPLWDLPDEVGVR